MTFINYASREINCKIVYCGPALSGKTTNLKCVYNKTAPEARGKILSLTRSPERTIFFDFLPLSFGKIRGFNTRFHLYTLPGQLFYESGQELILRGVDGIIFVADSQVHRFEANQESMHFLHKALQVEGLDLDALPSVLQFNKRDLENSAPASELSRVLNPLKKAQEFEAIAIKGIGVFETLKAVSKLILKELQQVEGGEKASSVTL
ncbi:MAG: gliding-motility protein MglA [Deltaproteobacteria bacterium]|nr:gliding-motility protein MglA [Deltaproteobacteria bacterium]